MKTINTDALHGVNARQVGHCSFGVLSELQRFTPEQQVAGVGVVLALLLRKYKGTHVSEVMQVSENLLNRASKEVEQLRAAEAYVEFEL